MKSSNSIVLNLMSDFLNKYLVLEKGYSKKTIISYATTYKLLLTFLYDNKNIQSNKLCFNMLNQENIKDFLDWLEKERSCNARTRNQRLAALNSFADYSQYASMEAMFFKNEIKKIPAKRYIKKEQAVFSIEEVGILLSIPDMRSAIGRRDRVLLSFMYATGARCSEICNIKVKNIHFLNDGANITIENGKGGKSRNVFISKQCSNIIKNYLQHIHRLDCPDEFVFNTQIHNKFSVSAIEAIFKKYIKIAKERNPQLFTFSNYSPHAMRRSIASHMLETGIQMEIIRTFLGHSSIFTTEIYATISQKKMDEEIRNWSYKWFPKNNNNYIENSNNNIPDFLNIK